MLGASLLFAAMGLCVGQAHAHDPGLSTFASSTARAVVNLLVLLVVVRGNARALVGDARPALAARGLFGALALTLYFASIQRLSVGEAAFLNHTSAAWVAAIAPFWLGERTSPLAWAAVAGAMAGTGLLADPRIAGDAWGRAFGLVSGAMAAGAYLSIRFAARTNPPTVVVAWFTAIASVLGAGAMLVTGAAVPRDPVTLLWLAGSGVTAAFAQLWMTEAYARGPTARVAAAGAATPALTALGGWLLLGQAPGTQGLAGMALLFVSGVALPLLDERRPT